jgi:hypothetical protein
MAKMTAGLALGGGVKVERDVMEIVQTDSRLGVAEIDRGGRVWDPTGGKNKTGAYVDDPDVRPELGIDLVVNSGDKGFGSQTVGESDLSEVTAALQEIVAVDFESPQAAPEDYVPPAEVIRSSWSMEYPRKTIIDDEGKQVSVRDHEHPEGRCMVNFRTKGGRGAKPAEIHRDRLPELIAFLGSLPPFFEQNRDLAWDNFNKVVAAREAKSAAEAAAESTVPEAPEAPEE